MASWELNEELTSSEKCACGQGEVQTYELTYSHTKVLKSDRIEHKTIVSCPNPDCPSR